MFLSVCPFVVAKRGDSHMILENGSRQDLRVVTALAPEMNLQEISGQGLLDIIKKVLDWPQSLTSNLS
jgi:hypothetical protein